MGKTFFKDASIAAASQFLGTEFNARASRPGYKLQVKEIRLKMGSELKEWSIRKVYTDTSALAFGAVSSIHFRSVDSGGVPGDAADTDVVVNGEDAARLELLAGEQVQVVTASASAAMQCRITYEEVPNDVARLVNDSVVTR